MNTIAYQWVRCQWTQWNMSESLRNFFRIEVSELAICHTVLHQNLANKHFIKMSSKWASHQPLEGDQSWANLFTAHFRGCFNHAHTAIATAERRRSFRDLRLETSNRSQTLQKSSVFFLLFHRQTDFVSGQTGFQIFVLFWVLRFTLPISKSVRLLPSWTTFLCVGRCYRSTVLTSLLNR